MASDMVDVKLEEQKGVSENASDMHSSDESSDEGDEQSDAESYLCKICSLTFASLKTLTKHTNTIHYKEYKQSSKISSARCKVELTNLVSNSDEFEDIESELVDDKRESDEVYDSQLPSPSTAFANAEVECPVCNKFYAHKKSLRKHMRYLHNASPVKQNQINGDCSIPSKRQRTIPPATDFHCVFCNQNYCSKKSLKRHKENVHKIFEEPSAVLSPLPPPLPPSKPAEEKKSRTFTTSTEFQCVVCGNNYSSRKSLRRHRQTVHKLFGELPLINNPVRSVHNNGVTRFQCELCEHYYSSKKSLQRHTQSVHGISHDSHQTDTAEQLHFLDQSVDTNENESINEGVEEHSDEENKSVTLLQLTCDLCNETAQMPSFSDRNALRQHKEDVHGVFEEYNQRGMSDEENILQYMEVDYGDDEAGGMLHTESLLQHPPILDKPKLICEYCLGSFSTKKTLRRHQKIIHGLILTGRTNFTSPATEKQIDTKINAVQSTEFQCDVCSRYYQSNKSLRAHRRKVHGIYAVQPNSEKTELPLEVLCAESDQGGTDEFEDINNFNSDETQENSQSVPEDSLDDTLGDITDSYLDPVISQFQHETNGSPVNQCDVCLKTFSSRKTLHSHRRKIHGLSNKKLPNIDNNNSAIYSDIPSIYPCDLCPGVYNTELQYKKHKQMAHLRFQTPPPDDDDKDYRPSLKKTKVAVTEDEIAQFAAEKLCTICDKVFSSKWVVRRHKKNVHGIPYEEQSTGNDGDQNQDGEDVDAETSKGSENLNGSKSADEYDGSTTENDDSAETLPTINTSTVSDNSLGKLTCSYCKKSNYSNRKSLRKHQLRIHGVRMAKVHSGKFPCNQCNKVFGREDKLRFHLREHGDERPFECTQCDQKFARSDKLTHHVRTLHLPYLCMRCELSFPDKTNYLKHLEEHSYSGHMTQ